MGQSARLAGAVAVMLAGSSVLTGCTGWPGGSTGAASSPPPAPPPPKRPEQMDEQSIEAASLAAEYFIEMIPYIQATGDLAEWESLSGQGCDFCHDTGAGAVQVHDRGGYVLGGEIDASTLSVGRTVDPDGGAPGYFVYLEVRSDAAVHHLGGSEEHVPAQTLRIEVHLDWLDDAWQVHEVGRQG